MRSSNRLGPIIRTSAMILALTGSFALSPARPATEPSDAESVPVHEVGRATSEIHVDGVLDEPAWSQALTLELNYEVSPGENIPPPARTVVLVTYDERKIYFGFRAYDPDPSRIRARFSDRDKAWNDDWVGVALDTFNDERRAYELLSNPLGVQMDALNDDLMQNYDHSWNAIWESAGRITEEGYVVEMALPFHQIRFQSVDGRPQTWGFDAFRSFPRSDRHHIGLFARQRGNNSYLSQTVKLVGMEDASPGKNFELLPTLTATRTETREELPDGEMEGGEIDPELGATVRWGITPNLSLNAAVNPDFSQVEADVLRLDINEQFTLFYPETRPFFLEGADYFATPVNLVHTRVIFAPQFAGKITGKQGRNTYGVFAAQDESTSIIFPGAEGSGSGRFDEGSTNSVARYRRDFGRGSTVGAIVTDRHGGDYSSQLASIDTNYRITDADRITASISTSQTRYSQEMIDAAGYPEGMFDDTFSDNSIQLEYNHSVRGWWTSFDYRDIGEGFRADLGYLPQVDVRGWSASGARVWWGERGDFHRRLAWGGAVEHSERQNGELLDESVQTWVNLDGPRQSSLSVHVNGRNQIYNEMRFDDQLFVHTLFEIQATEDLRLTFHQDYGDWIDYDNTRPATRTLIQPRMAYYLGRHLWLQLFYTYQRLDVEGGRLFTARAPEVRAVYQFNARAFIRAILQYTDIERDPDLYIDPVSEQSRTLFSQWLFAYKVNPHTAIYFGYSDSYAGTEEYGLTQDYRSLFIKLGYAWTR